jgi:hypothetical protein
MQHLELTVGEAEVLREVLQHTIHEMGVEVCRTDSHEYKEMLKRRRTVLEKVVVKLAASPAVA